MPQPIRLPRWWACLLVLAAAVLAVPVVDARPAQAIKLPTVSTSPICNKLSDPVLRKICQGATLGPGPKATVPDIGGAVGSAVTDAGIALFRPLAEAEANSLADEIKKQMDTLTSSVIPDTTSAWFLIEYGILAGFGLILALVLWWASIASAAVHRDVGEAGSSTLTFLAFLGYALLIPSIVRGATMACDTLIAPGLIHASLFNVDSSLKALADKLSGNYFTGTLSLIVPVLVLLAGIIGAILTQFELIVREFLLYMMTGFEGIALALYVGKRWTGDMFARTTIALAGLVGFKVIMALVFMVGAGMLKADQSDPVFMGAFVLLATPVFTWMGWKRLSGHGFKVVKPGAEMAVIVKTLVP